MGDTLKSSSGRMSPEPSAATKERTLEPSSKSCAASKTPPYLFLDLRHGGGESDGPIAERSWQTSFPLRGESWTPEVGEFPKDAVESSLSSILMDNPPEKYRLSARACVGILRRSEKRGKPLPPLLKEVLERQAGLSPTPSKSEADVLGGKGALIQEDLSATLATNNDQYLFQPLYPLPAYGFKAGQSVKARGIGWEEETSQTLGASMSGIEPTVCCPMPLQSKTIPKTAE
jgi:hypothetical protein